MKWSAIGPRAWDEVDQCLDQIVGVQDNKNGVKERKWGIEMNTNASPLSNQEWYLADLTVMQPKDLISIMLKTRQHRSPVKSFHYRL